MSRRAWTATTSGGFFIGALLVVLLERLLIAVLDGGEGAASAAVGVAGDQVLLFGWLLGLILAVGGQSLLWHRSGRRGTRWFLLSLPGLLAAWPVLWFSRGAFSYSPFTPLFLAALVAGLLLGLGQWVWWREVATGGRLWLLFSAAAGVLSVPLGWLLGIGVGYPLGIVLAEFTGNAALGAVVGGAGTVVGIGYILGWLTGRGLARLLPEAESTTLTGLHLRVRWAKPFLFALPIAAGFIAAIYYWFAVADRYRVFLYYHDMGPFVPATGPFSRVTASRYWMAALVASGGVLVGYVLVNLVLGRFRQAYRPPPAWRVWLLAAAPVAIGSYTIVTTGGSPMLPAAIGLEVVAAALLGLALALLPGALAAANPRRLLWLLGDGLALMVPLTALAGMQFAWARWTAGENSVWLVLVVALSAAGAAGFLLWGAFQLQRARALEPVPNVLAAAAGVSYLLLPLVHHLFFTDGYYYISDSDNFFARTIPFQVLIWLLVTLLVLVRARLLQRLAARRLSLPR